MDNRKAAILFLLPLMLMMVVPVSTHAQGVTYVLYVSCDSYNSSHTADTASLTFLGHGVTVFCKYHAGYHNDQYIFSSSQSGTYKALMDAGSNIQSEQGTFNPSSCFVQGEVYDRQYYTWAYFLLLVEGCYGP